MLIIFVNVIWLFFDDLYILERMFGYCVFYWVVRIGDENVEKGEVLMYNLIVCKIILIIVIEGLELYIWY